MRRYQQKQESLPMLLLTLVVMIGLLAFGIYVGVTVWGECRESGHSFIYCLSMVSK